MPATSLPTGAAAFELVGLAAAGPPPVLLAWPLNVAPTCGRLTSPCSSHTPGVNAGQGGGVTLGLYAADETELGLTAAQVLLSLLKSGLTGVGEPERWIGAVGAML